MTGPRVVVTGIGLLAANADSPAAFAEALREGRSGVGEVTGFDPGPRFRQAAEVGELPPAQTGEEGLDRVSRLALAAARQAVEDAGLEGEGWRREAPLFVGTSRGPAQSLERLQRPLEVQERGEVLAEVPFASIGRNVARGLGLGGPVSTLTMACVSSSVAVGSALDHLRRGDGEVALAGGADALTLLSYSGFSVLRAMTRSLCRPFDKERDGMVLGEGAALLVLETREHARRRGARIYAELLGWAVAGDAHHSTGPHPEGRGLATALDRALEDARLDAGAVDHLNLHGTGTRANDRSEALAVRRVFGDRRVPVNSLKPMIGHTLGGAGALELAGSLLGLAGGFVAPTLNWRQPDPECDLDVVAGAARELPLAALVSTKSAFGGANSAIVAGRP
jgi:3-oxoacyl-(acyl-carrier-protein) synthase